MDPEKDQYVIPYVYKDGEGKVLHRDTLYMEAPEASEEVVEVSARRKAAKKVLWSEDFENFTGKDDASTPQATTESCENVESFEGTAITINNGVKLASSNKIGQINFKKFTCSGDFEVTVDGKGWSTSESTCKILCDVCTEKEHTLTFTKDKTTLPNGEYETLEPVKFSVADGQTEVALSILAEAKKRVFIGKVEVTAEESEIDPNPEPDPDPEPDPEPTPDTAAYTGITIVSPVQGEELLETLLVARASLDVDEEKGLYHAEHLRLPEIKLEYGSAYSLEMELWHGEKRIGGDTVNFSVKEEEIEPVPVVTPDTVKVPTFSVAAGEVEKGTKVTISCATEGAKIYYSVNDENPMRESTGNTVEISIDSAMTIMAIAMKDEWVNSSMVEVAYTVKDSITPIDPTGTETVDEFNFELYPNPNRGDFCVDVPEGSRVEVFTSRGVLLKRLEDVSGLQNLHVHASGLYIVRVSVNGKAAVKRVIVE
ncbi:MAG: chitobiase/beta-hexosaminidase C-terminal domain-containing protein [Bacteroidales bacterium]|nr:chitobiase/beta-hexosaminidase C-terminal domain-containing protein [Bacteroidales bacterium]